jgi:hypothetical protein
MLYFIVPTKIGSAAIERGANILSCLSAAAAVIGDVSVNVFDVNSDVFWKDARFTELPAELNLCPFVHWNKSRVLNYALNVLPPDAIVFVLDADIVVPENLADIILNFVRPGILIFPVFYSLHKDVLLPQKKYKTASEVTTDLGDCSNPQGDAQGWWRYTSTGLVGGYISDFKKLGGYSTELGPGSASGWGGEDTLLFARASARASVVRVCIPGLYHQWHPPSAGTSLLEKKKEAAPELKDEIDGLLAGGFSTKLTTTSELPAGLFS